MLESTYYEMLIYSIRIISKSNIEIMIFIKITALVITNNNYTFKIIFHHNSAIISHPKSQLIFNCHE